MARRLAILAGAGALPVALAKAQPEALRIVFDGVAHDLPAPVEPHRFEALGGLFEALERAGVADVVLAGSMSRPPLDPERFDPLMRDLAPRLLAAMQGGDDALLRLVISLFEERGFKVLGAHEVLPDLVCGGGLIGGPTPSAQAETDASRGADILLALSPLDIGQACVVAAGLCLGIETLQGTDALLRFVADTPAALRRGRGVLVKAPKRGQDLRIDMPAIGPETVHGAARAGLEGIVIAAGRVLVLERAATLAALRDTGLFLQAKVL